MLKNVVGRLAGLLAATAFALTIATGGVSGVIGWLVLAGVALGVLAVAMRMRSWRPVSSDPEAESARARLEWIWRSGYGGNAH